MPDPLDAVPWPVRTARLTIRRATGADAETTWAVRCLPEVSDWMSYAPTDLASYADRFTEPARMATALIIERDETFVGEAMLRVEDAWAQAEVAAMGAGMQAELGCTFHPDQQGHGYATEAGAELLRIGFEGLGLHRVVGSCFADNTASWRLMERIGMRREAHNVGDSLHRSGQWLDGYQYALLADEWRLRQPG